MAMFWFPKHSRANPEMLGYLPMFLSENSPLSAREQMNINYSHGGGWHPMPGFRMLPNGNIQYPGDPVFELLYEAKLRDEIIRFYTHEWMAIIQKDGSFEVSRVN